MGRQAKERRLKLAEKKREQRAELQAKKREEQRKLAEADLQASVDR